MQYSQHISDHIKETFATTPSSISLRTLLLHIVLLLLLSVHITTACSRTWTSTTTAILYEHLLCRDLQYNKMHIWIQTNITSTARLSVCSSGLHKDVQTSNSQRKITLDILQLRWTGLATSEAYSQVPQWNHALKVPHLNSIPQGHSLPFGQLMPLHINTYCDSDWATDIESRNMATCFQVPWPCKLTPGIRASASVCRVKP